MTAVVEGSTRTQGSQVAYVVGEGAVSLFFGTLVILVISRARGADFLGAYAAVVSWIGICQGIAASGIGEIVLRDLGRILEQSARTLVHALVVGLFSSGAAMAVLVLAALFLGYPPELRTALVLGTLVLPAGTVVVVCRSAFMAHGKAQYAFALTSLELAVVQTVNIVLVLRGAAVASLVVTTIAGRVIGSVAAVLLVERRVVPLSWRFDRGSFVSLVLPLPEFTLIRVLGLLFWRADVIILSKLAGLGATGTYSAAMKLLEVLSVVPSAFAQVTMPGRAREHAASGTPDARRIEESAGGLFLLVAPIALGVIAFAPELLSFIFGESFERSVWMLRIVIASLPFLAADLLLGMLCRASGQQRRDLQILASVVATNLLLNFALVPAFAEIGAAVAMLGSCVLSFVLHRAFVSRAIVAVRWLRLAAIPLAMAAVAALAAALVASDFHWTLRAILFASVYGALTFVRRRAQP